MRIALFQPDIPQNAGAVFRLAACLGAAVDLIGPCGFVLDDRRLRRAAMDYLELLQIQQYASWNEFLRTRPDGRLVLLTTGGTPHVDFAFRADDTLLLGRESVGAPPEVHAAAHARLRVPMVAGARSLNVATAAAVVLGEARRQIDGFAPGTA